MMYKGLVDNLTFVYAFLAKGRGKLGHEDVAVAQKVDVDIEGMTVFLMSQEII